MPTNAFEKLQLKAGEVALPQWLGGPTCRASVLLNVGSRELPATHELLLQRCGRGRIDSVTA
jgi:hypothetical protein